jgi:hypothetical protein
MRGLRVILYNCRLYTDDAYIINLNREVSLLLELKLASSSYKIIKRVKESCKLMLIIRRIIGIQKKFDS